MRKFYFHILLFFPMFVIAQTRVVCVGNSVTAGYGLSDPNTQAWPARLGALLGNKYVVYNCGVSGTTMLKNGSSPYWNTSRFNDAINYNPDILIISLGTNDAHPSNWVYKNDFYNDYAAMIDAFRQNGRNPKIYVCYPLACYGDNAQISNLQNELIPLVSQVSKAKGASIIDFNTPTQNQRNTLYNDNLHPNAAGATLLGNVAYQTITPAVPTFYNDCNYGGAGIKLGIGDYNLSALTARGINNDNISSIKVPVGYKVFAYVDDNFAGNYLTLTSDNSCLGGWDNLTTSIRVRANGVTGKNGTYHLENRSSGKNMDITGGSTADGADVIQWSNNGGTNQQFTLTDEGDGCYRIISVVSGKAVDVSGASTNNAANVLQWTYNNAQNQRYILLSAGNDYFKLKAAHSGRILEIYGGGANNGDHVNQYDDNNQTHGQWKLVPITSLARMAMVLGDSSLQPVTPHAAVTVYPNPATTTLRVNNVPSNTILTVFDLNGHTWLKIKAGRKDGNPDIDISRLKPGVYIIQFGNNNNFQSVKFVKI